MNRKRLEINDHGYFEMQGLNILVFSNTYSAGHQGGVEIIQNGMRTATCGEIRLSPTYGQFQPLPRLGGITPVNEDNPLLVDLSDKIIDRENNEISMPCRYPDEGRHMTGFSPLIYPDLDLSYTIKVKAEGADFTVTVDFDKPVPDEWTDMVGFCLELFPVDLYGKTYFMDEAAGIFPRQAGGPTYKNSDREVEPVPLAIGKKLVIAPECDQLRMTIKSENNDLQLIDGSLSHNNGWFIVRSGIPKNAAKKAVQWKITPNVLPDWKQEPVIRISQVGYHPSQAKTAYIELDKNDENIHAVSMEKLLPTGGYLNICSGGPKIWGQYYRYKYLTFDFTSIIEPGIYRIKYGENVSSLFKIGNDIYTRGVWQPTLEYFLPVQMCHMRIGQKYRLWHDACHMDDALMAPPNIHHFDGYSHRNYKGNLPFKPLEHIPDMNTGGWHDAGDFDIRMDTQIETSLALAYAYEEFRVNYDETTVNQKDNSVEIHQPDGVPDVLQQLEHGMLWLKNFYEKTGVIGMGVIVPTLRQDMLMGDPAGNTDNKIFTDKEGIASEISTDRLWFAKFANKNNIGYDPFMHREEIMAVIPDLDDRLLFFEENTARQFYAITGLAASARVLKGYNDGLSRDCLRFAKELWEINEHICGQKPERDKMKNLAEILLTSEDYTDINKIQALTELILTTGERKYIEKLLELQPVVINEFACAGWAVGRVMHLMNDEGFKSSVLGAARDFKQALDTEAGKAPFGCFRSLNERLGMHIYYLNKAWPEIFTPDILYNIVHYTLGCHGGDAVNSLLSGVGVNSALICFGFNRADWSYIPGGSLCTAVNLVNPDFLEDREWAFFWQEREYLTSTSAMLMFDIIAADYILNRGRK